MIDCSSCRALRLASDCSCLSLAMRLSRFLCADPAYPHPLDLPGRPHGQCPDCPTGLLPLEPDLEAGNPPVTHRARSMLQPDLNRGACPAVFVGPIREKIGRCERGAEEPTPVSPAPRPRIFLFAKPHHFTASSCTSLLLPRAASTWHLRLCGLVLLNACVVLRGATSPLLSVCTIAHGNVRSFLLP
jgi:hypothetical protein